MKDLIITPYYNITYNVQSCFNKIGKANITETIFVEIYNKYDWIDKITVNLVVPRWLHAYNSVTTNK